jgi:hypothetical protein
MKKCIALIVFLNIFVIHAELLQNRHALIIGVSEYKSSDTEKLMGVPYDIQSATKIALAMGIPQKNITYLKDSQATKSNIISAIQKLGESTSDGSRAFVYFSGHGSREVDPQNGNCVDGLLSYEQFTITNAEFASAAQKLTKNADKVITMVDACYSGGVLSSSKSRSLDLVQFKPKFFAKSGAEACKPTNLSRGLVPEMTRLGGLEENVVQITSSRPDEVSYDNPDAGGVATVSFRDCLLGEAKDTNQSGAVSIEEVQQCAQTKVDKYLQASKITQHVAVSGNRNLIPVAMPEPVKPVQTAFNSAPVQNTQSTAATTTSSLPSIPSVSPSSSTVIVAENKPNPSVISSKPPSPVITPTPASPAQIQQTQQQTQQPPTQQLSPPQAQAQIPSPSNNPAPISSTKPEPVIEPLVASLATLKDIEQQRNPRKQISVKLNKPVLKIGKDYLDLSITSQSNGYLYLVLLGSDAKSFYLLYPNGIDKDNFIKAGQTVRVPKPNWGIQAAGPNGTDHLLVMVADSPRKLDNLTRLELAENSEFTYALNDLGGRQALINYLTGAGVDGRSESFGAQLVSVKEVK